MLIKDYSFELTSSVKFWQSKEYIASTEFYILHVYNFNV